MEGRQGPPGPSGKPGEKGEIVSFEQIKSNPFSHQFPRECQDSLDLLVEMVCLVLEVCLVYLVLKETQERMASREKLDLLALKALKVGKVKLDRWEAQGQEDREESLDP